MPPGRLSNPLALAVLTLLYERPMHPYEMSATLRERHKEESIKLNFGSLYAIVTSLERHKFIEVQEVVRDGNRPERTIYAITESGKAKMVDWLSDLISIPVKEFPQFEAALSLMLVLGPDDVIRLLEARLRSLMSRRAADEGVRASVPASFPRIFMIESEYATALIDAEITYLRSLIDDLRSGAVSGVNGWRRMHELRATDLPPEQVEKILVAEFPHDFAWREEMPD